MRLEEALQESSVHSAVRPFYTQFVHPLRDRKIVWRQDHFFGPDVYIVYADTFKFDRSLQPEENYKVQGRTDWEPVKPTQARLAL